MEYNAGFARPTVEDEKVPVYIFSTAFDYLHYKEINRVKGFPYYQFMQCTKGIGKLYIYNNEYEIKKGDVFLLPKNVPHRYIPVTDEWLIDWIVFSGSCINEIMKNLSIDKFSVAVDRFSPQIHNAIKNIVNLYQKKYSDRVMRSTAVSYEILTVIKSLFYTPGRLLSVINFIHDHISNDLSLAQLSNIINVTPEHLCRMFKSQMNMRPFEYINLERIQLSKQFLYESNFKISEIASMCGFKNENYFRDIFKKHVGISPSKYRHNFT